MVRIREFNENGIQRFKYYLAAVRETGESETVLSDLLSDETYTRQIPNKIEIEPGTFSTKYEIARYLHERVSKITPEKRYRNIGMWTWLAVFYFDLLCPADKNGVRKIGEDSRYILNSDEWDRVFRHLLAGPVMLFDLHKDNSIILLYNPVDESGDFLAQLTGRIDIGRNKTIIETAKILYFDPVKLKPKRGAALKEHKPGTLRRFVDVLYQLDLTYDLYSMSSEELIRLLPPEFKSQASSAKRQREEK